MSPLPPNRVFTNQSLGGQGLSRREKEAEEREPGRLVFNQCQSCPTLRAEPLLFLFALILSTKHMYRSEGGTPSYGLYRYVRPQRVWFFSRFSHKLGIDFSHFAAILVINRESIFCTLVFNSVFLLEEAGAHYPGRSYFFIMLYFSHPRFAILYPVQRLLRMLDKASFKSPSPDDLIFLVSYYIIYIILYMA